MIAIQGKDLAKSYGGLEVLKQVTFSINVGDKVGVVGSNGAGKTTLFRCLIGEELPDTGQVMVGSGLNCGVVEQKVSFNETSTLEEELLAAFSDILALRSRLGQLTKEMEKVAHLPDQLSQVMTKYQQVLQEYEEQGGYAIENRVRQVVSGLGFAPEDSTCLVHQFSGGQQTRVSLGKLLLKQPGILLLDEPTNHLDMASSEWLEGFLKNYPGTILVISHDRYFLEEVCTKILELEQGKAKLYPGNYSKYRVLKGEQRQAQEKAYEKQQEYIKTTEQYIERFRAGIKSKQARGRQKQLERLERVEQTATVKSLSSFQFPITEASGERVLELVKVGFYYTKEYLFRQVTGLVRRGEKVALVGPNGCGKTTFLKVLTGAISPKEGELRFGSRVKLAYYSQQHEELDPNNLVLGEIVKTTHLGEKDARPYLGKFLFSQEDVFKQVGNLSGGEKSRLALLKLFLQGANFLILDEPTNHLDITAKEVLEEALIDYEGTVILVSHDRFFLDQVVDKIWEFNLTSPQGLNEYLGNYSYYRLKKAEEQQSQLEQNSKSRQKEVSKGNRINKEVKEREKEEKRLKRQKAKALAELELQIMTLEEEKEDLGQKLADPNNYYEGSKAKILAESFKKVEEELISLYEQWEELAAAE